MKILTLSSLLTLAAASTASPQTTTFDIASFTPPAGWQRTDQNALVQLQNQHTVNGRTTYCQIFLFPSHPGAADAAQNFAANGRFASAAAAMTTMRISETELLQTTNAYFGNGAYTINGSTITLTTDSDRGNPKRGHFRVEQVSKDGSATWTDRLCLLLEGIGGEVCYTRDQEP